MFWVSTQPRVPISLMNWLTADFSHFFSNSNIFILDIQVLVKYPFLAGIHPFLLLLSWHPVYGPVFEHWVCEEKRLVALPKRFLSSFEGNTLSPSLLKTPPPTPEVFGSAIHVSIGLSYRTQIFGQILFWVLFGVLKNGFNVYISRLWVHIRISWM
jgi:hypothetical protein